MIKNLIDTDNNDESIINCPCIIGILFTSILCISFILLLVYYS
mgnify:CR=1 FL=1